MKFSLTLALLGTTASAASAFVVVPNAQQHTSTSLSASRRDVMFQASVAAAATLFGASSPAFAEARPTYLTEPTDEFKASEEKRMEFKRAQLQLKVKLQAALDKLSTEENDEAKLVDDVEAIRDLIIEIGGMPLGIKKDDLVKQVRAKKAKGFWPTKAEYSYQGLINEIAYQQSPNKDKDIANPL